MKRFVHSALVGGVLTFAVVGCENKSPTPPPAPPTNAAPTANVPAKSSAAAGDLGSTKVAGPFKVTLSTNPPVPPSGKVTFLATITRGGKQVTNASARISTSMPSMDNMAGTPIDLKPVGDHYEGLANLTMGGKWVANVNIKAGGSSGSATYTFNTP